MVTFGVYLYGYVDVIHTSFVCLQVLEVDFLSNGQLAKFASENP
jgi:hypothetical protein